MKKILLIIITTITLIILLSVSTSAKAVGGNFGKGLTWTFENGVLTISGSGAMPDYEYNDWYRPWSRYIDDITEVIIGPEIT